MPPSSDTNFFGLRRAGDLFQLIIAALIIGFGAVLYNGLDEIEDDISALQIENARLRAEVAGSQEINRSQIGILQQLVRRTMSEGFNAEQGKALQSRVEYLEGRIESFLKSPGHPAHKAETDASFEAIRLRLKAIEGLIPAWLENGK